MSRIYVWPCASRVSFHIAKRWHTYLINPQFHLLYTFNLELGPECLVSWYAITLQDTVTVCHPRLQGKCDMVQEYDTNLLSLLRVIQQAYPLVQGSNLQPIKASMRRKE